MQQLTATEIELMALIQAQISLKNISLFQVGTALDKYQQLGRLKHQLTVRSSVKWESTGKKKAAKKGTK